MDTKDTPIDHCRKGQTVKDIVNCSTDATSSIIPEFSYAFAGRQKLTFFLTHTFLKAEKK